MPFDPSMSNCSWKKITFSVPLLKLHVLGLPLSLPMWTVKPYPSNLTPPPKKKSLEWYHCLGIVPSFDFQILFDSLLTLCYVFFLKEKPREPHLILFQITVLSFIPNGRQSLDKALHWMKSPARYHNYLHFTIVQTDRAYQLNTNLFKSAAHCLFLE